MTPKEKAIKLFEKFRDNLMWSEDADEDAKQCALTAVDEIIQTLNYDIRDLDVSGNVLLDLIKYWKQVKEEIEKL